MKPSEMRTKNLKELVKMADEKREALFGLKLKMNLGQLAKTSDIRIAKRDVARLLTIIKEKNEKTGVKDGTKGSAKN